MPKNYELSMNEKKFAKRYVDMYVIQVFNINCLFEVIIEILDVNDELI